MILSIISPPGTGKTTFGIKLLVRYFEEGKSATYLGSTRATVEAAREIASIHLSNEEINIRKDIRTVASLAITLANENPNNIFENVVQTLIFEGKGDEVADFFEKTFKLSVNPRALILSIAPSISYWKGGETYFHFMNYLINNTGSLEVSEREFEKNFYEFNKYLKIYNNKVRMNIDTARYFYDKFLNLINRGFQIGKYPVSTFYGKLYIDVMHDFKNTYDVVLCDEGNENPYLQYLFIKSIGRKVIYLGDINQTIQSYGDILKTQIVALNESKKVFFLKKQRRMSPEIWNFVINFLENRRELIKNVYGKKIAKMLLKSLKEVEVVNKDRGKVLKIHVKSEEEALNWIKKFARENAIDVIITRRREKMFDIEDYVKYARILLDEDLELFARMVREIMYLNGSYSLEDFKFIMDSPLYTKLRLLGINEINKDTIANNLGGLNNFLKLVVGKVWKSVKKVIDVENTFNNAKIMTIHRSKGKTFDGVVVYYDFKPNFMKRVKMYNDVFLYELRNLYVGITRARRFLAIIYHDDELF